METHTTKMEIRGAEVFINGEHAITLQEDGESLEFTVNTKYPSQQEIEDAVIQCIEKMCRKCKGETFNLGKH